MVFHYREKSWNACGRKSILHKVVDILYYRVYGAVLSIWGTECLFFQEIFTDGKGTRAPLCLSVWSFLINYGYATSIFAFGIGWRPSQMWEKKQNKNEDSTAFPPIFQLCFCINLWNLVSLVEKTISFLRRENNPKEISLIPPPTSLCNCSRQYLTVYLSREEVIMKIEVHAYLMSHIIFA